MIKLSPNRILDGAAAFSTLLLQQYTSHVRRSVIYISIWCPHTRFNAQVRQHESSLITPGHREHRGQAQRERPRAVSSSALSPSSDYRRILRTSEISRCLVFPRDATFPVRQLRASPAQRLNRTKNFLNDARLPPSFAQARICSS